MANVTISRKLEKGKHCIIKKEGKRKKYYCVDQKELKDYLYDIMYMQDQNINLAVRIIPEKKKFYEYSIYPDRIQITEKEILSDQDPESYVSAEYLGEPLVIIKEPLSKLKAQYGGPWYQEPKIIILFGMLIVLIVGFGIFFIKSQKKAEKVNLKAIPGKPSKPPVGKALSIKQKEKEEEGVTKDALYNIAYAIEQAAYTGLPVYISSISYALKDNPPAQGKDETIEGNLSITFRFAYPAKGSMLITTKPIPIYSKTVNIKLKPLDTKSDNLDNKICGMNLLNYGLNLYNVDKEEFKGDIKDYKTFYAFIQTLYHCKAYIQSLNLTNLQDIASGKPNGKQNINVDLDVFLLK